MLPRTAMGASFIDVFHVGVCGEDRVAGSVSDAIIGIGGEVVQWVVGLFVRGVGCTGLFRADGAETG